MYFWLNWDWDYYVKDGPFTISKVGTTDVDIIEHTQRSGWTAEIEIGQVMGDEFVAADVQTGFEIVDTYRTGVPKTVRFDGAKIIETYEEIMDGENFHINISFYDENGDYHGQTGTDVRIANVIGGYEFELEDGRLNIWRGPEFITAENLKAAFGSMADEIDFIDFRGYRDSYKDGSKRIEGKEILKAFPKVYGINVFGFDYIDDYAFARCDSLRTLNFGSSLLTIGNYAFADCDTLSTVVIPNSVKQIGNSAFWNCRSLDSLVLGFSLETIGESAFEECSSMRTVKIGNSLTTIGKRAFYGCSMLKSLIIPPLVTSIGDWAFAYCNSLEYVTAKPGTPPTVDVNTWGISIQTPLYVPCGKYNDYAEAEYWKEFVNIEERPVDYTIVLNANNPSHGKVVYNCPTSSIEAVPSEWRYFVKWEDGNTQNPRHVVITSDTMFTAIFEIGMGANEPMALRSLKFYPNPTNGVVSFNRDDIQKVEVMDLNGKLLDVQEYSTSVDFSNLSSGTYILRISTPDGIAVRKLIKK
jgi:hypothetical protein